MLNVQLEVFGRVVENQESTFFKTMEEHGSPNQASKAVG